MLDAALNLGKRKPESETIIRAGISSNTNTENR
jgi:hypothetical protein